MSDEDAEAWEYRVLRPPREPAKKEARDPTTEFNDLGREGWKLIETIDYVGGGTKFLVFRRPDQGGDPDDVDDLDESDDAEESEETGTDEETTDRENEDTDE